MPMAGAQMSKASHLEDLRGRFWVCSAWGCRVQSLWGRGYGLRLFFYGSSSEAFLWWLGNEGTREA